MATSAETEVWQEPVRGGYIDPARFLRLTGLEYLKGYEGGGRELPPPIHYLTGMTFVSADPGTATFTMPVTDWLLAPQGVVAGAALGFLVDGPLGCTVQTALPKATPYTTSEISFSFLRTVLPGSGTLTGVGRLVHSGRSIAISEVEVRDDEGRLVATTSSRCIILPRIELPPGSAAPEDRPQQEEPDWPSPHPFQRPARGEVLPQETFDRLSGLEIMEGHLRGEIPAPPISRLCGVFPLEAEAGRMRWKMPASEWLCSPVQGRLYGGATAYLAGTAIDGAIETTVKAGTAFAPLDLKVYFLRPVVPDGRDLVATGTVVHRGRTVAVATSEVLDGDGKRVAMATGSAMILPGRPASVVRAAEELAPEGPS